MGDQPKTFVDDLQSVPMDLAPLDEGPRKLTKTDKGAANSAKVEEKLYDECLEVLDGVVSFADLDPEHPEVMPKGWVERFGKKEAIKRQRLAAYALMSAKNAPIGIQVAKNVAVGVLKARAESQKAVPRLNVSFVQMTVQLPHFQEKEVIDAEGE